MQRHKLLAVLVYIFPNRQLDNPNPNPYRPEDYVKPGPESLIVQCVLCLNDQLQSKSGSTDL